MGRPTFYWQTTDTAAGLVLSQIPRVFETARATERMAVIGKEQEQAEPYGDYYPYVPSMFLVQGNWVIPEADQSGSLVLGLPTVGPLLLKALIAQDMFLAGTIVLLLGVMTVIGTLISDILLVWVDPRIRLEET